MSVLCPLLLPSHRTNRIERTQSQLIFEFLCLLLNFRLTWLKSPFMQEQTRRAFLSPFTPFFFISCCSIYIVFTFSFFSPFFFLFLSISLFTFSVWFCVVKCLISFRYLPMCVAGEVLVGKSRPEVQHFKVYDFFFFVERNEWEKGVEGVQCVSRKKNGKTKKKSIKSRIEENEKERESCM